MEARQVFWSYDPSQAVRESEFPFCPRCGSRLREAEARGLSRDADERRPTCPSCGFVCYRNPLPGVVTLVERDDHVLLGRRGQGTFRSGAWCLPGGFMEWSEDYLSAGRREVREETGIDVKVRSILSVVTNYHSPRFHTLVVVLLAAPGGGELRAGDDLEEVAWFPLAGPLPEMAFEADRHIVERFAADRLAGAPVDPAYAG